MGILTTLLTVGHVSVLNYTSYNIFVFSGVGRIFVWGPYRGAQNAEGRGAESAEREGRVKGLWRRLCPLLRKIFDYLILKWRILMHI